MSTLPDPTELRVLLLDADGNLFPSEAPAFDASAEVTNEFLASLGIAERYTPEHLLATTTGKNFRTTAIDLAAAHGVPVGAEGSGSALTTAVLDDWVAEEKRVVSAHLGRVLRPDPAVLGPLRRLAGHYQLAAVSSSALSRLDECFRATGLAELIPPARRYSAEDSLPAPTSKPDPAIYRYAAEQLGVPPGRALAVEDSLPGARSAVAAGIATAGNVTFVPAGERDERRRLLTEAGVAVVVESWEQLADLVLDAGVRT
ncbi:HAD family hydrolase [Actinoplanes sp. RD1]|uniref:HAD family hydrolase n=1 Tax=Actinoplanes sp. RD1 TaxID=3064538 RepID=UPI00274092CE|nr:HAD family phosphatase [Actinoplanes sp. RD1]